MQTYGWPRPLPTDTIIFYCQTGTHCLKAAEQAALLGYKCFAYTGSWVEWEKMQSQVVDEGALRPYARSI